MDDRHRIDADAFLASVAPKGAPRRGSIEWELAVEELSSALADEDPGKDAERTALDPQAAALALFAAVRRSAVAVAAERFGRASS